MTFYTKLHNAWTRQNSLLCVGLDPQAARLPDRLTPDNNGFFEFCRAIVEATHDAVCAYKPQFAHFAALGLENQLAELIAHIKSTYPHIPVILDAKRGDVGSTAEFYAQEAFERYDADAVTVSPYLGYDSIAPYLQYRDRAVVVLCRTSNPGSDWLQNNAQDATPVFERVAAEVARWNDHQQCLLVTGATYPEELGRVRQIVGDMPLLVPGVGAQGGTVAEVLEQGADAQGTGLVISSSRGIIFAHEPTGDDDLPEYAAAARRAAHALKNEINSARRT